MAKKNTETPALVFEGMTLEDAIKAVKERGYFKCQKEDIKNFFHTFGKEKEYKNWKEDLKEKAYSVKNNMEYSFKLDKDGNKIPTGEFYKNGKPKYERVKTVLKTVKSKPTYNHTDAKKYFFEKLGLEELITKGKEDTTFDQDFDKEWD